MARAASACPAEGPLNTKLLVAGPLRANLLGVAPSQVSNQHLKSAAEFFRTRGKSDVDDPLEIYSRVCAMWKFPLRSEAVRALASCAVRLLALQCSWCAGRQVAGGGLGARQAPGGAPIAAANCPLGTGKRNGRTARQID